MRTFSEEMYSTSGHCISSKAFFCIFAESYVEVIDQMHHSSGLNFEFLRLGGGPKFVPGKIRGTPKLTTGDVAQRAHARTKYRALQVYL